MLDFKATGEDNRTLLECKDVLELFSQLAPLRQMCSFSSASDVDGRMPTVWTKDREEGTRHSTERRQEPLPEEPLAAVLYEAALYVVEAVVVAYMVAMRNRSLLLVFYFVAGDGVENRMRAAMGRNAVDLLILVAEEAGLVLGVPRVEFPEFLKAAMLLVGVILLNAVFRHYVAELGRIVEGIQ